MQLLDRGKGEDTAEWNYEEDGYKQGNETQECLDYETNYYQQIEL